MSDVSKQRVAIQGVSGCFHHQAAEEYFGRFGLQVEPIECDTFDEVVNLVADGNGVSGMMAIENTIAGPLLRNHELLRKSDIHISGEQKMRISHSLAALPGQSIQDIQQVNSHAMALMQCEEYLLSPKAPKWRMTEVFDTAGAARDIARDGEKGVGAICSAYAAELYGLEVLARGIETNKHNFTRFLVLKKGDMKRSGGADPDKASMAFTLPHTQGALSSVLAILSFYGLNLSKIQSMPIVGREWEYRFYIDVTFTDYGRYKAAINAVLPLLGDFRLLGEYSD